LSPGRIGGVVLAAMVMAGCVSAPDVEPQETAIPVAELGLDGPVYVAPTEGWWRELGDPQLDALVEQSLVQNPGLGAALARVRGAWEQSLAAAARTRPQLELETYLDRQHASANYIYPPPFAGSSFWAGSFGVNFAWHLDFWGRQAALIDQAGESARAAGMDAAAASLALSGSVAQTYVDLQRTAELQRVADRARAQRARVLDIAQRRVTAGIDTPVELRSAEAALAQVDLEREQLRLARKLLVHALAELSGSPANAQAAVVTPTIDLEQALPLPATLPADLLAHRPDVAAAQARIAATQAGWDAARAAFYPNIDLLGFVGVMGISVDKIFQSDSQAWQIGPALHLPIFDAGRLRANYRQSVAEFDAAVAGYNQVVLRALRESMDQLTRVLSIGRQLDEQGRSLAAAEEAYRFAVQRYEAGISSYLTVLSAETQLLNAQRQRTDLLADRMQASISLLVALGGRFDYPATVAPAAMVGTREKIQ
jgi:NodT family efflux transporter outer membrane factor (OMF) lipoprotein